MSTLVRATLASKSPLTDEVTSFEFTALNGRFEGCEAGAHIDVHLAHGLVRNYSVTDWHSAGAWVRVAVKLEPGGRGGSRAMHSLQVGDAVEIGGPRNHFALRTDLQPILLVGGGIGITPIYAMAQTLSKAGRPFDLHYLVRSRALAAFHRPLVELGLGDRYRLHCGDEGDRPDFVELLGRQQADVHVYVCGPEPLLSAVVDANELSHRGSVFFERFSAATLTEPASTQPFEVVVESTGQELAVPADQSVLQTLRSAGFDLDYACSEGVCGTCIVDVLEGEIDHRDAILTNEEKDAGDCMCICVSRAKGRRLVLAL